MFLLFFYFNSDPSILEIWMYYLFIYLWLDCGEFSPQVHDFGVQLSVQWCRNPHRWALRTLSFNFLVRISLFGQDYSSYTSSRYNVGTALTVNTALFGHCPLIIFTPSSIEDFNNLEFINSNYRQGLFKMYQDLTFKACLGALFHWYWWILSDKVY